MKTTFVYLLVVLGILGICLYSNNGTLAISQDTDPNNSSFAKLIKAKSIRITLKNGATADWSEATKEPKIKIGKWSSPKGMDYDIFFDSIDLKAGKARMIGNQGATDVSVFTTLGGISFIETSGSGNVFFTTVFSDCIKGTQDYIVVHSRHLGGFVIDKPMPSQWHGTGKILE